MSVYRWYAGKSRIKLVKIDIICFYMKTIKLIYINKNSKMEFRIVNNNSKNNLETQR